MKKSFTTMLAATAALGWASVYPSMPALADSGVGECAKNTAMLPVRALGVGAGFLVGVPVAILRRTSNRCLEYTNSFADKIGGKDSGPAVIMASVAAYPLGVLVGTEEGVFEGSKNAIQGGVEKPFGLTSLSLGEMEEH